MKKEEITNLLEKFESISNMVEGIDTDNKQALSNK